MVTLGYLYETEVAAIEARDLCDNYYGCPNHAAQHWVSVQQWGYKWAIIYNDTLPVVLGAPIVLPEIDE